MIWLFILLGFSQAFTLVVVWLLMQRLQRLERLTVNLINLTSQLADSCIATAKTVIGLVK
jgi:hypothetical protein